MAELSKIELNKILDKLRTEYKDLARTNPKAFNAHAFEERYYQVLKIRGNTEKFLMEEVKFLEALKQKHKSIQEKQQAAKGETFDRILAEQEEKLAKYSRIDFHPAAKKETRYFYGAMADFNDRFLPLIEHMFRGTYEMNEMKNSMISIERIGYTRRGIPSIRINQHIKSLLDANGNPSLIEKESQNLLKEGCLALKNIHDHLLKIKMENRYNTENKIRLSEKDFPRAAETFQERSYPEAIDETIRYCRDIIQDFRMTEIAGLKEA